MSVKTEYAKQKNRVEKLIKKFREKGYDVRESIIPKDLSRPTSKSVEKLRKITTKTLYENGYYISPDTGKRIAAKEEQHKRRSEAAKRGWETRIRNKEREAQRIRDDIFRQLEERTENESYDEYDATDYDVYDEYDATDYYDATGYYDESPIVAPSLSDYVDSETGEITDENLAAYKADKALWDAQHDEEYYDAVNAAHKLLSVLEEYGLGENSDMYLTIQNALETDDYNFGKRVLEAENNWHERGAETLWEAVEYAAKYEEEEDAKSATHFKSRVLDAIGLIIPIDDSDYRD